MSLLKELEAVLSYYSNDFYLSDPYVESIVPHIVINNHIHLLQSLLSEDKSLINMKYDVRHKAKNSTGRTLLKIACQSNNINYEIILCLLKNGANIDETSLYDVIHNYQLKLSLPSFYDSYLAYICAIILEYV